jgi:hypothetical protein
VEIAVTGPVVRFIVGIEIKWTFVHCFLSVGYLIRCPGLNESWND